MQSNGYTFYPSLRYTDPLALHAIEMDNEYLVPYYNGDMDARAKMHDAQCLAGMAFSNASFGNRSLHGS